ncbi:FAD-dependent oxidoreductase [Jannaschia aquimarina]|uniref:PcpB protein n=1 Tax=Jannaschia aquimarina TaxID=935700 RepID=A0A0D1D5X9_9RHOB|nr:FAD-dependent oxidoreductase [Jannaschia aquimarina]KIT15373.1 Pentachlorophenol 4-monooxygenase [Jannaschia aquimarina]SNT23254.1 3-(3-hydroxy-phenyl)propionate hydroxylase [Jannaschia aquimarina]
MPYDYTPFPYRRAPGLDGPEARHPVFIVGAGPIGLALALDLARHGTPSVLVDDNDVVSVGSRAICWSKRSLEILDRLGLGERAAEKGVGWKVGRTFHGEEEVFSFDLQPEPGHKFPAFVNLQQYYVEQFLAEAALDNPLIDLRFKNRVTALDPVAGRLEIETPDGAYTLEADHICACDGARSPIRQMMGLEFDGEVFEERFLIADIEMQADFPSERRFWFEPTFHAGQSALLHRQPDDIYRIDLQLGWDADPEHEKRHEVVRPRIEKVVGHADFRIDWVSVYTFQCRRLTSFLHDRVIFVGDSAHVVSPFGARGGNGGLQDVDALGWRLAAVAQGAEVAMLRGYDRERGFAADENIRNSARATRFMTPADGAERLFRDQVLKLAAQAPFARGMVNSGRLSVPCTYPLDGPDAPDLPMGARPGTVAPDAPLGNGWLSERTGHGWLLLAIGQDAPTVEGVKALTLGSDDVLRDRYLGDADCALYLLRPDGIVAARWRDAGAQEIEAAREAACL